MIVLALVLEKISNLIWGPALLALVLGSGAFLTVAAGFFPLRKIGFICKSTFGRILKDKSAFAATATALGATVGTGNIIGVAAAIEIGGAGAVFWMWVGAFWGMMLKFAESALAVKYRGGAPAYIKAAFGGKGFAAAWCLCCVLASFGGGNMVQSNAAATAFASTFALPPVAIGVLLAALTAAVLFGGAKAVTKTASFLVPFMAGFYVFGCFVVLFLCKENIFFALGQIFGEAIKPASMGGGFFGILFSKAVQTGIAKGTFTHEAGMGSASLAHSESKNTDPKIQGCWGIVEVFIDTIFVCTLTALVILCGKEQSAERVFHSLFGVFGDVFIAVSMFLFALAAIIGWAFYGEKALKYITKSKFCTVLYRILFCFAVVMGSAVGLPVIWSITDIFNGLMIFPNLAAILLLRKEIKNIALKK